MFKGNVKVQSAVGSQQSTVNSRQSTVDSRQSTVDSQQSTVGSLSVNSRWFEIWRSPFAKATAGEAIS